ncbi:MAG: hypothetical protein LBT82_02930 [Oscillospiraceae bacterium]|jgi:hypothetical protein|nr:hypothetical protein [Oscillospiraceae bacterium]
MKKKIFTSCFLALSLAFSSISASAIKKYYNNWPFSIPIYCEVDDEDFGLEKKLEKFVLLEDLKKQDSSITKDHIVQPLGCVYGNLDFTENFIVIDIIPYKNKDRMLCIPAKFLAEKDMYVTGFSKIYIQEEWWNDDFVEKNLKEQAIEGFLEEPYCRVLGNFRNYCVVSHSDVFPYYNTPMIPEDKGRKEGENERPVFICKDDYGVECVSVGDILSRIRDLQQQQQIAAHLDDQQQQQIAAHLDD